MSYRRSRNSCNCSSCCEPECDPYPQIIVVGGCQTSCCPPPCNPCPPYNPSCPPCNPCNNVVLISQNTNAISVPSGGTPIPVGTVISPTTTTIPVGTVTLINSWNAVPTTSCGYITMNNGFFTIPTNGTYNISAFISFDSITPTSTSDTRVMYIYLAAASTGLVSLLAMDSRLPINNSATTINLSTIAELKCGDRIFAALTQSNANTTTINTVANIGKIAIAKV